ncbi:MAG: DUF2058 domain-containing protein [Methylococcaceae bacterium]
MANSFGDQLVKAGLVKRDQLNKAKKSQHKQRKQESKKVAAVNETAVAAQKVTAEKAARDSELNRQNKAAADHKAIQAQIRQLVELNRLPKDDGDVGYNFQDGSAIKKLFVSEEVHNKLQRGFLTVVRYDAGYEVIPSVVAEKIKLRDAACIINSTPVLLEEGEDDPYADYKVPDDLMW